MDKIIVKFLAGSIIVVLLVNFSFIFISSALAGASSFGQGLSNTGYAIGYQTGSPSFSLWENIGHVLLIFISFVGVVFLALIIYGGVIWMLARGNETEVTRAKNIILYAVIGLVVVLGAYAITTLISTSDLWKNVIGN
jgi:cbb3-type cytochrome oxidase subunit 3